jgi:uncharacterized UBP type Zn finger protein
LSLIYARQDLELIRLLFALVRRSKEELYRHLSLDVGEDVENDHWTVERGLAQFFQPERRELKCEKCTSGTTATQTIEIITWQVLV